MEDGITFEAWPKIARLNRGMVITEKLDGTNAAIIITDDGRIGAQSRSRLITPENDNYGFARWVSENEAALVDTLGPGRHFGEWWGAGIQRRYGLAGSDKRLSLFNTGRWTNDSLAAVPNLNTVPIMAAENFSAEAISTALERLRTLGSVAAPGFMDPEGIVVYLSAARTSFKVTLKGDEAPKGASAHEMDEQNN